jgi:DNA polymerase III delta subunit
MKYTVTQLRQDIDRGQLRPVYFFYGPEEFLKERFIEEILGKLVSPDLKDFNLDILYGDETDATSLIDRVASLPMMAERRLVLVRNVDTMPAEERRKILEYSVPSDKRKRLNALQKELDEKRREWRKQKDRPAAAGADFIREMDHLKAQQQEIVSALRFAFPHTCLLLIAASGDLPALFYRSGGRKRKPPQTKSSEPLVRHWLDELIEREVAGVKFSSPSDDQIPDRIGRMAHRYGKSIANGAVDLLVKAIGSDLMALDNELAKLSIFIGQRAEITSQDVELVVGELRVRSVFDLCETILSGDRPQSILLLGHLLEQGIGCPQLTGALRWRFTHAVRSNGGRKRRPTPQIDAGCWENAFDLLYQTELSVNSGRQSPKMAMTLLTDRLCRLFAGEADDDIFQLRRDGA